jgi:hypothetical protein
MNLRSKLARIAALLFSLTLLAGYVVYSHVTPNTPPPDPLGLNDVESRQDPDPFAIGSTLKADYTPPASKRPGNDLRIIGSKTISQPVFSVRRIWLPWESTRRSWSRRDPFTDKPEIGYKGFGISLKAFPVE